MPQKFYFVPALLFLFITAVRSQELNNQFKQYKKDSLRIRNCRVNVIVFPINRATNIDHQLKISFPFSSFEFKDVRYDKNYIGVSRKKDLFTQDFLKLKLKDSTENELDNFFNINVNYDFHSGNNQLLCFVKQLRITQIDSTSKDDKAFKLYTTARVEIEAFMILNDHLYPAVRFDTTTTSFCLMETDFTVLAAALKAFANKAAFIDTSKVLQRTSYSVNEIQDRYAKRFYKPIIRDTVLNKGVYETKEEFLNNNPSKKEYQFSKEGFLYTKTDNNEWALTRNSFGFCDGSRIWMNINKVLHPLIRQGETFEFIADLRSKKEPINNETYYHTYSRISNRDFVAGSAISAFAILIAATANNKEEFVHQLNLETGEY